MVKAIIDYKMFIENNAAEIADANTLSHYLEQELEELLDKAKDYEKRKMKNILALMYMIEHKCKIVEDNLYELIDKITG